MPADSLPHSPLRQRATLFTAIFLVVVGAALGVGAWQLARAQDNERADLRSRYSARAVIATGLVDSLFRLVFQQQAADAAKSLAGTVTTAQLDARVRQARNAYIAIIDGNGRFIAGSSDTPQRIRSGAGAAQPHVRTALKSPTATGISDLLPGGIVEAAVRYPGHDGTRVMLTASPQNSYNTFLSGAIRPLAPVVRGDAYVLDGRGMVLGAVSGAGKPARPNATLVADSARSRQGTYDAGGEERYFAAAPVPETRWRIAISAPTRALYGASTGVSRWLPWLVLAICALAFVALAVLVRRTIIAGQRLSIANDELERSQLRLRERAGELQRSNVELQRSNADLEQFAYVASHDLSAPLRAVAGFSQLLAARYRGQLDGEADEFIRHMQEGVDRMQRIIDDLLSYSRVDRSELTAENVDLEQVLADVLRGLGPDIDGHEATVTHDPLPVVRGERGQLGQVLQNLIANGMKFTAPGVAPTVHVSAERENRHWRIGVRDNGIGIEPEHADRIFKMFQRLHGPEEYPGTGIGLAISKKIVERHGGDLTVEPAPGGGSLFVFTVQEQVR
jgi:signal transduction histidine kinase